MRTDLFDYELPQEQIAVRPPAERDAGRLLDLSGRDAVHRVIKELPQLIRPGDLVVLNDTRVRRARLLCHRPVQGGGGGAQVELLFLGKTEDRGDFEIWEALGRANRPLRALDQLESEAGALRIHARGEQGMVEVLVPAGFEERLARAGQMPIPPYMQRPSDEADALRYQTVFAQSLGSAAAPTAGLHLTERLLTELAQAGAELGTLTLHVGIGTFRPVKSEDLDDHPMHSEWIEVSEQLAGQVAAARSRSGRVLAIGTTVVRALESMADQTNPGTVLVGRRATDLLIQPGYEFQVVDAMLTNFHLPKSTLLALVCAFSGREHVLAGYRLAVAEGYRFLSYGDGMWLSRDGGHGR